jgi:hypothetical protein
LFTNCPLSTATGCNNQLLEKFRGPVLAGSAMLKGECGAEAPHGEIKKVENV